MDVLDALDVTNSIPNFAETPKAQRNVSHRTADLYILREQKGILRELKLPRKRSETKQKRNLQNRMIF